MYHFTFWLICRLRFQRFCFLSFGTRIRTFRFQFLPHSLECSILDGRNSNITRIGMSQTVFTRTLKFFSRIWITRWIWLDMKRTRTLDHEWPWMVTNDHNHNQSWPRSSRVYHKVPRHWAGKEPFYSFLWLLWEIFCFYFIPFKCHESRKKLFRFKKCIGWFRHFEALKPVYTDLYPFEGEDDLLG